MTEITWKFRLLLLLRRAGSAYGLIRSLRHKLLKWWINQLRYLLKNSRYGPPVGFFSAFKRDGKEYQSTIRIILDEQSLPTLPANSLIRIAGMNQIGYQPWPVFTMLMGDTMLVGSSLAPMSAEKLLLSEALYDERHRTEDPAYNYIVLSSSLFLKGNWTSITSRWSGGYFHWLMDDLPRLAPLNSFPLDTGIIIRGPIPSYKREALQMLGYESKVRECENKNLKVEKYHFSSPVGMTGCTNPYVVKWLREKFLHHAEGGRDFPKKILILRHGKTRGILNIIQIKEKLEAMGWVALDMEGFPFKRQIAIFANAECIVAEHGAALSNLVWCRPGTKVMELCPESFLNGCYEGISLCVGLDHHFEIFKADRANRIHVPLERLLGLVKGW